MGMSVSPKISEKSKEVYWQIVVLLVDLTWNDPINTLTVSCIDFPVTFSALPSNVEMLKEWFESNTMLKFIWLNSCIVWQNCYGK